MNKLYHKFLLLFSLLLGTVIIMPAAAFIGMKIITPAMIVSNAFDHDIFWQLRVPRVLCAFLAGSGLALCGMVFQALFRNPLADPFTLGTASGASCGAAVTILAGMGGAVIGIPIISIGAFLGAAGAMGSVYGISSIKRKSSNLTILLAGIAVSFLFSSMLMFLEYMSSLRDSFQILRWLMGGIEVAGYGPLITMLPFWFIGTALVLLQLPRLDQMLAGEDLAHSRGVNTAKTKAVLLIAATFLIGGIVAVCGPIGFVGLMVPHICRRLFSAGHLFLGPATIMFGGCFLVVADTLGRTVFAPVELPVGIITALIGGPFFLWMLFGKKRGVDSFE